MCRHSFYMSNIYETTIIVKPDLANDQMKNLNTSIEQFFSDNEVSIGYKEDWGIKNLKFSINKYSKGFLKFNTDCLRFLITKSNDNIDQATPQINKDS